MDGQGSGTRVVLPVVGGRRLGSGRGRRAVVVSRASGQSTRAGDLGSVDAGASVVLDLACK